MGIQHSDLQSAVQLGRHFSFLGAGGRATHNLNPARSRRAAVAGGDKEVTSRPARSQCAYDEVDLCEQNVLKN